MRDDRPFAGPDPPAAVFFYSPDRGGEHPEQHLASYAGLMQADTYAGFGRLYQANRKPGPIVEAACWAQPFFDLARLTKAPIAAEAVKRIDVLFAIEREINGLAPQERLRVRQERSRPLIVELQAWLREQRAKLSRNNDTTKAINYCLSRWDAFTASLMTDGFACRTMPPSASYGLSPSGEETGPSPAPMRAAGVRLRSTPSSPPPSSTTSIHRLGSPTCWRACRIIPPGASTNSCLGTGALRASLTPHKRGQPIRSR